MSCPARWISESTAVAAGARKGGHSRRERPAFFRKDYGTAPDATGLGIEIREEPFRHGDAIIEAIAAP